MTDYTYPSFSKAQIRAAKEGVSFYIANAFFVEQYDEEKHKDATVYNGEELKKLDFDVLPRSKAVVMDESRVFLSMREAAIFCNGKTVDATADFITKNIRKGKPAMGHIWRVATKEEVIQEVMRRVEILNE